MAAGGVEAIYGDDQDFGIQDAGDHDSEAASKKMRIEEDAWHPEPGGADRTWSDLEATRSKDPPSAAL